MLAVRRMVMRELAGNALLVTPAALSIDAVHTGVYWQPPHSTLHPGVLGPAMDVSGIS